MAHIKTGTTTKGNRDSVGKRLGVKKYGGSAVINGNIIIRQKGSKYLSGKGTRMGKDFTIYAIIDGSVLFKKHHGKSLVEVLPAMG
jgi:large subunit ribosomal protein L27